MQLAKAREDFNVPEETTVGYRKYKVLYRPKRKTDLFGECDTTRGTVSIFKHSDRAALANTFFHEHLHAIYKEARLHDRVGDEHEEDIVRTLADGVCQWFVANPHATVWLLKQLGVINAELSVTPVEQGEGVRLTESSRSSGDLDSVLQDQTSGEK